MVAEEDGAMRDEIFDAIALWCGSLEAPVTEQNTLPNTGPAVQQVLLGLGELAAAVVLASVDTSPDWAGKPVLVESAVSTLFETVTEEGLAEGAAKGVADQKAKQYQNLVASPDISAMAKKYGLPPESVARDLADDFGEQTTHAIRSVTPLVLRVAKEPWSVAALEERLAAATAGTGRGGSAVKAVDEPAPAAPGGPAAAWYADPTGRHQYRFWDGASWTTHVANDGVVSDDQLTPSVKTDDRETSKSTKHALVRGGSMQYIVLETSRPKLKEIIQENMAFALDLSASQIDELLEKGEVHTTDVLDRDTLVTLECCECSDPESHRRPDALRLS